LLQLSLQIIAKFQKCFFFFLAQPFINSKSKKNMSNLREINGRLQNQPYVTGFHPSTADSQLFDEMFSKSPNVAKWAATMACYYQSERNQIAGLTSTTSGKPGSASPEVLTKRLDALEKRWEAIEKKIAGSSSSKPSSTNIVVGPDSDEWKQVKGEDESVGRLREIAKKMNLRSVKFKWVPSNYYQQPLTWRRDQLGAPTMTHLCKSIVLENTHCVNEDCSDRNNSRYYVVVFPYTERFDSEKLMKYVRSLNESVGKKKFNFRLAAEGETLSGYSNNAIPPFGLKTDIPVILASKLAELSPAYFWAGGGHVDCKVRLDFQEALDQMKAQVADVTNPIPEEELSTLTGI
jgi:prolyl-tRNA editing enzyme YbaK/EbsC (Cys-tRNA(Pro) deacylase)